MIHCNASDRRLSYHRHSRRPSKVTRPPPSVDIDIKGIANGAVITVTPPGDISRIPPTSTPPPPPPPPPMMVNVAPILLPRHLLLSIRCFTKRPRFLPTQKLGSTLSYKVAASNSTGKTPAISGISDPIVNSNNNNNNHSNFVIP